MSVWGVVVAAGVGSRFGGLKQLAELRGEPTWVWSRTQLLAGGVDEGIVVGPVEGGVPGGTRRRDSVSAGLAGIPSDVEFVLIHDAVRPLASAELVKRVIDRLGVGDADGVVPGIPVRDTLKEIAGGVVVATLDRSNLVVAQTPQGFRMKVLARAHALFEGDASDDASMVEAIGGTVVWVEGDPRNLKLTYPDDLAVLEALI